MPLTPLGGTGSSGALSPGLPPIRFQSQWPTGGRRGAIPTRIRRHRSKLKVLDNKFIVMTLQILGRDTTMALVGRVFTAEQAPTVEDLRGD